MKISEKSLVGDAVVRNGSVNLPTSERQAYAINAEKVAQTRDHNVGIDVGSPLPDPGGAAASAAARTLGHAGSLPESGQAFAH